MSDPVERELAPLIGRTLAGWARESNMLSLHFRSDVGDEHTLHVFCAWRIARPGEIIAGGGDLYTPSDPDADLETFDWDEPGSTWWDQRLDAYFASHETPPRVMALRADDLGGFRLACDDGAALEVFPSSANAPHVETEFWRLITPGVAAPHVVADTSGVRVQQQS
jgi:hypothetical protein